MRNLWRYFLIGTAAAALPSALLAETRIPLPQPSTTVPPSFAGFHAKDQKLQRIGRKLALGNAAYCKDAAPSIGLTFIDMRGFARPAEMRRAFNWASEIGIATVPPPHEPHWPGRITKIIAAPSPRALEQITAIDGVEVNAWPSEERLDWRRLKRVHDAVDASLADNGSVMLTNLQGVSIEVVGVPACRSRFEVKAGGKKALADGLRVQFGSKFPGFSYPEDEFAAVIAHELAHNILQHRKWLDAKGRKRRAVRATEREADRMMPWLMANAGYDPKAAVRFMQRWGPKHSRGIFRARTHDGWDERVEIIAAEAELVTAQMAATGTADWQRFFRRDIAPLEE